MAVKFILVAVAKTIYINLQYRQSLLENINFFAALAAIATTIAVAIEVWYRVVKYLKKINKKREEKKLRYFSLKKNIKDIIDILEKSQVYHFEGSGGIGLINIFGLLELKEKIDDYNRNAELLSFLSIGFQVFSEIVIEKNVLKHLSKINARKNELGEPIPWKIASQSGFSLSTLLPKILNEKIFKGEEIKKGFINTLEPSFYSEIKKIGSEKDFEDFLRELNEEIEYQQDYGLLKIYKEIRSRTIKLAKDLMIDIEK